MDPETRQMLLEAITLSRENNKMLRSMRSSQRWNKVFTIVKYLVLIALVYGGYIYLAPYFKNLQATFDSVMGSVQGLKNL